MCRFLPPEYGSCSGFVAWFLLFFLFGGRPRFRGFLPFCFVAVLGFVDPTVANHANPFGFRLAVELGALHEILLAAYALGVAEACFG